MNSKTRPNWTDYFLGLAKVASQRSHDIHTQHGCVITDRNNRILGVGYNGFPKAWMTQNYQHLVQKNILG